MMQYLCCECKDLVRGKRILELGSGTGLGGIACAVLGARVTLTDMEGCTRLLKYNAEINMPAFVEHGGSCEVLEYNWGTDIALLGEVFDGAVMSDVVYDPVLPLVVGFFCSNDALVAGWVSATSRLSQITS